MILVINASPFKNSKTEKFCVEFEKSLKANHMRINLRDRDIPPSKGTYQTPNSIKSLLKDVRKSEGMFIATPTYWYNIPATLKAFLEQLSCINSDLWQKQRLLAIAVYSPEGGEF